MSYSFMEFVYASSISRWHIRKLTDKGQKFGGGIDTAPLCGHKHNDGGLINGWDLKVDINDRRHDDHTCLECLDEYSKMPGVRTHSHKGKTVRETEGQWDKEADDKARDEVEQDLHRAGIIEDPDMDGGLLG